MIPGVVVEVFRDAGLECAVERPVCFEDPLPVHVLQRPPLQIIILKTNKPQRWGDRMCHVIFLLEFGALDQLSLSCNEGIKSRGESLSGQRLKM